MAGHLSEYLENAQYLRNLLKQEDIASTSLLTRFTTHESIEIMAMAMTYVNYYEDAAPRAWEASARMAQRLMPGIREYLTPEAMEEAYDVLMELLEKAVIPRSDTLV